MRKTALSVVCVLFLAGMAYAADAPLKQESCGNVYYEDNTYWLFGTRGEIVVSGTPHASRKEKDRELTHYVAQVRKWNSEEVTGLWWKSWRPNKVAAQYLTAAQELDSSIEFWSGCSDINRRYAAKTASTYRQIAEMLTLSASTDAVTMANKASDLLAKLEESEIAATGGSSDTRFEIAYLAKK